jgi:hypothetical protein
LPFQLHPRSRDSIGFGDFRELPERGRNWDSWCVLPKGAQRFRDDTHATKLKARRSAGAP